METENKTIRELTRIYLDSCKDVAIEALKVSKNKRKAFVHEAIADHEWVIISYYSRLVGVLSDNVHAYQDSAEYQENEHTSSENIAYYAMTADVNRWLENDSFLEECRKKEGVK